MGFVGRVAITLLVLVFAMSARAETYRRDSIPFDRAGLSYDHWTKKPPEGWTPDLNRDARLGLRLPLDWDEHYRVRFGQYFQPNLFYMNSSLLCNFARTYRDQRRETRRLFHSMYLRMMEFAENEDGLIFIRSDFPFSPGGMRLTTAEKVMERVANFFGTTVVSPDMEPGWSSAIVNGFVIAGLVNALDCFDRPEYRETLEGLAAAYSRLRVAAEPAPERWISYVDEDGYLWFEEYPLTDGRATLVLNGHIFALFGLVLYADKTGDESVIPLIEGGLTTVRDKGELFRREGQINAYSLRIKDYADYSPDRTVRQQCQLYAMTGEETFRRLAYMFRADIEASGRPVPDWAVRHCAQSAELSD
jgi:hypothetical protein